MPIKPYVPASPPLKPTHIGFPTRRISALIIEEDLSDVDTADSSWFLPANLYETVTISQKEVPESLVKQSNISTEVDTSRRPSIALARLQTRGLGDVDIHLPNYNYAISQDPLSGEKRRRDSSSSEVYFRSPLRRCRTYSDSASSPSTRSSGSHSPLHSDLDDLDRYESPLFYADSDCDCDCACIDDDDDYKVIEGESAIEEEEEEISKSAKSLPIEVPKTNSNVFPRRRRGCFVEKDVIENEDDDDESMDDDEDSVEDFVQFAYTSPASFETALISEVVRRRKSDEHFSLLKSSPGSEKELENAQFSESHRRSQWMRDMVRFYPQECGGGHMLPSF